MTFGDGTLGYYLILHRIRNSLALVVVLLDTFFPLCISLLVDVRVYFGHTDAHLEM